MSWPVKIIRWSLYLTFFIVPLIFLPNTSELFEFNKMVAVYFLTTLIAAAWLTEILLRRRLIFRRTPLDLPILIFLASQLLSYFFSIDHRTSLLGYYSRFNGGLVSLACYAVLYWACVSFMNRKTSARALTSLLVTSVLVSIYGVLQHFGIDASIWVQDVKNRVFSTLGQPNWLAAYLVALIFIPLSRVIFSPKGTGRVSDWLTAILLLLALFFTKSRSGYLALGLSLIVFAAFYLKRLGQFKLKAVRNLGIFLLLVAAFTFVISNPIRDQYLSRFFPFLSPTQSEKPVGPALETGGTESGTIREIVWTGAIRIWRSSTKNLLIGTGPETFAMAYYQHRPVAHNATSEWELLYNKAHNEFLNYLSTTGLVGLLSYLALLLVMIQVFLTQNSALSQKNSKHPPELYSLNLALFCGWLTLPVTNFWGFSVVIINVFLFVLPALAISLTNPDTDAPPAPLQLRGWQTAAFVMTLFTASYAFFCIFKYWLADVDYASGQKYLKSFTATQEPAYILSSYDSYLSAYQLNPADPPISSDLATVMAYMSLLTSETDASASAQLADTALTLSQQAIDISPYHPNYYKARSRTAIILSAADPKYLDVAQASLESAHIISPTDPRILYNLAAVAKYKNDLPAAKNYLKAALQLKPDFADALAEQAEIATASSSVTPESP